MQEKVNTSLKEEEVNDTTYVRGGGLVGTGLNSPKKGGTSRGNVGVRAGLGLYQIKEGATHQQTSGCNFCWAYYVWLLACYVARGRSRPHHHARAAALLQASQQEGGPLLGDRCGKIYPIFIS